MISNMHQEYSLKRSKVDVVFAHDIINDNNKFEQILLIKYLLKTLQLVIMIFNISFLVGMFWMKYVEVLYYILDEQFGI